jgi:FKBP-type peptidyl-prolyl cis-trans isomerase
MTSLRLRTAGVFAALCLLAVPGCDSMDEAEEELVVEDVVVGPPSVAEKGSHLKVHYVGWLENGTEFESSRAKGAPYSFRVGVGEVIDGWDRGLIGMRVGGKRRLTVPPSLAYGNRGAGCPPGGGPCVIPPNTTLIFEIELLEVRDP